MTGSLLPLVTLGSDPGYLSSLLFGRQLQVEELERRFRPTRGASSRPWVVSITAGEEECPYLLAERLALCAVPRLASPEARVPGQLHLLEAETDVPGSLDAEALWAFLSGPARMLGEWRARERKVERGGQVSAEAWKRFLEQASVRVSFALEVSGAVDLGGFEAVLTRLPSVRAERAPVIFLLSGTRQSRMAEVLARLNDSRAIQWLDLSPLGSTCVSDLAQWRETLSHQAPALAGLSGLEKAFEWLSAAYKARQSLPMSDVHPVILEAMRIAPEAA